MQYYYYKKGKEQKFAEGVGSHDKKEKDINVVINCGNGGGEEESAAFRAVNGDVQTYGTPDEFVKVLFQVEQFDIGNVYNANTSTFVPTEEGIYFVGGTVTFFPNDSTIPYRARVEIRVNGVSVAADNDFFNNIESFPYVNAINTSTVLQLQAGDLVEIFLTSTAPGIIDRNVSGISTRFEASKF